MDIPKPKILDFIDVDSDKWRLYAHRAPFPHAMVYRLEFKRLRLLEQALVTHFDACLVVSEKEKALLPDSDRVVVVPNGIDLQYFTPRNKNGTGTLLFSGAMNYFANIDGALYFHKEVFPAIARHVYPIKFVIAGMHPARSIRQLADKDTLVTGYVPDMRTYIADAAVSVVPLRIAKGIQNKILEAMAMEVPVVATSVANHGINAVNHEEILLADGPEDFAKATVRLLTDGTLRKHITRKARKYVETHWSWEHNLSKLDDIIDKVCT